MLAEFPDLAIDGLQLVDTGFGSTVVETGEGMILRIGRTTAAARGHAVEAAVLPGLAPLLPVAVPVPTLYSPQTPALPFGVIGYRRLPGEPCQPHTATAITGRELGGFLASLHHVDSRDFPALPSHHDVWQSWHKLRKATRPVLQQRLTSIENQRISEWWDQFLNDQRMQDYLPTLRHGDLWYGNLLVQQPGTITAVLDWEAVAVADPAQDLALARYLGASFAETLLSSYREHGGAYDKNVRYRIERHWELRELTGIPLAVAVDDEAELSECIAKLKAGPVLG